MVAPRSSPAKSPHSRSAFTIVRRTRVFSLTRRRLFLRAEVLLGWQVVRHNAGSRQLRRDEAVGWSHRPGTMRACDADSTRIHDAEMERPAFGVATTERWSQRVSGVTHGSGPLCCRQNRFRRYARYLRDARPADAAFSGGDGFGVADLQPLATHTLAS